MSCKCSKTSVARLAVSIGSRKTYSIRYESVLLPSTDTKQHSTSPHATVKGVMKSSLCKTQLKTSLRKKALIMSIKLTCRFSSNILLL